MLIPTATGRRCTLWMLLILSTQLSADRSAEAQQEGPSTREQIETKFSDIQAEIDRLREEEQTKVADELSASLNELRELLSGGYRIAKSDTPESHVVMVREAGIAPPGVLKGADRFKKGYVEVQVADLGCPVILVLGGDRAIHWRVKVANGVRLHAVVLTGREGAQSVDGHPAGTLVFDENAAPIPFAYSQRHESFGLMKEAVRQFTGQPVSTFHGRTEASSQPVVISSQNSEWRAQHLLHRVTELHQQARKSEMKRQRAALAELKFKALWFIRQQNRSGGGGRNTTSMADFTIDGPIESSLRPTFGPLRHYVDLPAEKTKFGIDHWTQLVIVEQGAEDLQEVPLDPQIEGLRRLNCLAWDSKRNRLVFPSRDRKPELFALDMKTVQWSKFGTSHNRLGALTYDAKADVFYGIPLLDTYRFRNGYEKGITEIERISADGSGTRRIGLSEAILPFWGDHGGIQLRLVDDRLVIVVPPIPEPDGRMLTRLYVVNPQSGDVLYSGLARVHDGKGQSQPKSKPATNGLLARFNRKVAEVHAAIASLREIEKNGPAEQLASKLDQVVSIARGLEEDELSIDPVLCLVGTHSGDKAVVQVTQTNRPVVLAVSSYNRSTWKVEVAPDAQVLKVIAAGYHEQFVEGLPEGVPVETYSYDQRNDGFYVDEEDDPKLPRAVERLREVTGLELSTFLVTRDHGSIEVGPGNATWQLKRALARMDDLLKEASELTAVKDDDPIANLRFYGQWAVREPHPQIPGMWQMKGQYLAQFTSRGPVYSSMVSLTSGNRPLAASADGKHAYALGDGGIIRINPQSGGTTAIPLGENMPPFSHPRAVAVDTSRNRALVASLGGDGVLYAYDFEKKKWSASSLGGIDLMGLAWLSKTDTLYGLTRDFGDERLKLARLTSHGVMLESVALAGRIPELAGHRGRAQLASAGELLVIQTFPGDGRIARAPSQGKIYVVNPTDGSIVHSAIPEPHPGHEDFTTEQLTELWGQLRDGRAEHADRLAWRLAAGGDRAVQFLADVLHPAESNIDEEAVQALIAQLGSREFAKREAAQKKLAEIGSGAEPLLRDALKQTRLVELRRRISSLLQSWQDGEPASPEKRRELLAVTTLERIASPAARRLLSNLASGAATDLTTRHSKSALERLTGEGPGVLRAVPKTVDDAETP